MTTCFPYHWRLTQAFILVAMLLLAHPLSAETLGPVTDPIGVVRIPKGAPISDWRLLGHVGR